MVGTISGILINERGNDHDMTLIKGATVNLSIVWGGSSSPIDVTGFTGVLQVRNDASDANPLFEFTVSNSRVTIGDTDGIITFQMTATDTAALTLGDFVYALKVVDASGNAHPVMSGKFTVAPGAT